MTRHQPALLFEASADIDAPISTVTRLILQVRLGPVSAENAWLFHHELNGIALTGGPTDFTFAAAGRSGTIYLDVIRRTIAYEGGWWYRGEYQLTPSGTTTCLTYRVHNVATRLRWGVPLANRFFVGFASVQRQGLATTVDALARELTCTASLRPPTE